MTIKILNEKSEEQKAGKLLDQALVVFLVGYGLSWLLGLASLYEVPRHVDMS